MELCSSIPFLMAELDEVRTGETGFQQQYKFWNSRQPLRNKRPNLFRFNFFRNVFCPIPPCVAEAVELVWTCQTGPAQCSHSSAWVLNYQQLTLHRCYITIKCKILLVPAKDQLSVQFLGDLHLQIVILPLTRFEKKTIQQQLLLTTTTSRSASQAIKRAEGWKRKSWTSTITSCPRTGQISKKGVQQFCKKNYIDCLVAGMDMGAGSVLTTLVEAPPSLEKPTWWRWGRTSFWPYSSSSSSIWSFFRMEISSGPWRRTVGAQRYYYYYLQRTMHWMLLRARLAFT